MPFIQVFNLIPVMVLGWGYCYFTVVIKPDPRKQDIPRKHLYLFYRSWDTRIPLFNPFPYIIKSILFHTLL